MSEIADSVIPPQAESRERLYTRSFIGLLLTQFLVALNDNVFRWLIIPIGCARVTQFLMNESVSGVSSPSEAYDKASGLVLAVGGAVFLLPFVLFSGWGGYCADRYSKRNVMIWCKVSEIIIMVLGVIGIYWGNIYFLFISLFIMGAQSAFFSPSKYSSISEIVPSEYVARANGVIGLTTMIAIILGTFLGGLLYDLTTEVGVDGSRNISENPGVFHIWISASVLIGIAVIGLLTSFMVQRLRPCDPSRKLPWNPLGQSMRDLSYLWSVIPILLAALGSGYYWGLGALAQSNIQKMAVPELVGTGGQTYVGYLLGILTLGIGLGCAAAGMLSRGKSNMKLVPFAAMGIGIFGILLGFVPEGTENYKSYAYFITGIFLFLLGCAAGMYDVPLLTFIQENSVPEERGRAIGGSNFISFTLMFLASGVFWFLTSVIGLSPRGIWITAGVSTLVISGIILSLVFLKWSSRVIITAFLFIFYRIEIQGAKNLPQEGPALLVSNHVSFLDGLILLLLLPLGRDEQGKRFPRIIFWAAYGKPPLLKALSVLWRGIPIYPGKMALRAVIEGAKTIKNGEMVGIFPEGGITRNGTLMPLKNGCLRIIKDTDAPVCPIYMAGLWGSIFSFHGGRFFWKWPERLKLKNLL